MAAMPAGRRRRAASRLSGGNHMQTALRRRPWAPTMLDQARELWRAVRGTFKAVGMRARRVLANAARRVSTSGTRLARRWGYLPQRWQRRFVILAVGAAGVILTAGYQALEPGQTRFHPLTFRDVTAYTGARFPALPPQQIRGRCRALTPMELRARLAEIAAFEGRALDDRWQRVFVNRPWYEPSSGHPEAGSARAPETLKATKEALVHCERELGLR